MNYCKLFNSLNRRTIEFVKKNCLFFVVYICILLVIVIKQDCIITAFHYNFVKISYNKAYKRQMSPDFVALVPETPTRRRYAPNRIPAKL